MKTGIHPDYQAEATIACACGKSYKVGSTSPNVSVELCSNCHPFYTGKQKIVDTARRVEKFETRGTLKSDHLDHEAKQARKAARAAKKAEKKAKSEE
jgi:large subunit ribosomal protein L31